MSGERLFFALWPDPMVRNALTTCREVVGEYARGRAIPVDNLHITLSFLGSIDNSLRDSIIARAAEIHCPSFDIEFNTLTYRRRQQMIWLDAAQTPPILLDLVAQLRRSLTALGIRQEERAFVVHVTMMRNVKNCVAEMPLQSIVCSWPVKDFVLVRSRTLPAGAVYEIVHRFPLGAT